ncbi:MAG: HEAT repeat domain-containing protein [Proteobacteria bacterium]|nr:HEAT repeat domain-containing protein [Pseudomonadota bacterium]MBU1737687.1 HEAT repeat domain-containing protein [Pseudomonadota bacterium]
MAKGANIKVLPWCPFCGQNVDKPQEPLQRKMDEFTTGTCQCGAVYTCDPTGFNVGAAMVECLVHACNDNWDLAWELMPDDDYLSGRLDKYDEQTHQVVELGNLDGRKIKGVLYFIRLSKDYAELVQKLDLEKKDKDSRTLPVSNLNIPEMEPKRDPKRKRRKADKKQVAELADQQDIDTLVDLAFDDLKTLRYLQRLLYSPDEKKRWEYAHLIGQVCRRLSTRKPGAVSDMLHRMYEACSDSAATHWGLLETVGAIIAARSDIYGGFTRHLLMFRGTDDSRATVLWALGEIAATRPDLVRNTPFYSLFSFVEHPDPLTRGQAIRLFGRILAEETRSGIEKLLDDETVITIYEGGEPRSYSISGLAREALSKIDNQRVTADE